MLGKASNETNPLINYFYKTSDETQWGKKQHVKKLLVKTVFIDMKLFRKKL